MPAFTGVAVNVTDVPGQITLPGFAVMLTLTGKPWPTDIVIVFDVAGLPAIQVVAFDVNTTLIASPFTNEEEVYVLPVSPTIAEAPLNHWYVGLLPPLVGVAVNVTEAPLQIVLPGFAAMLTLTGKFGLTVIVIVFDVAGLPVIHAVALDVSTTLITSPFTNEDEVYVLPVSPMIAEAPLNH